MEFESPAGNRHRRRLLQAIAATGLYALLGRSANAGAAPAKIRFGLTPEFLHDQHVLVEAWRVYLEGKVQVPIEIIVRDSYRETMDLLRLEKLDAAWICDYPFVHLGDLVRLLVVPTHNGRPYYRSYLIVSARNAHTTSIADLRNGVFAYADPYSNTGYLAPRYELRQLGFDPKTFFSKTFFTWSHRKAIEAVAYGLAQGAAVDSFIWETLTKQKPGLVGRTRIVSKSQEFGFPPLVVHRHFSGEMSAILGKALRDMALDPAGRDLLAQMNLDGFIDADPSLYDGVAKMMRAFGEA